MKDLFHRTAFHRWAIAIVAYAFVLALGGITPWGGGGLIPPLAAQTAPPPPAPPAADQPAPARLTPEQLHDLVAPIALYPDALVAQILAGSAYPTQIVEANRFVQENPNLKGTELAAAVDHQDWDPSVKALTAFPSVLADMDKNLSWTSTLGDANYNQQADVMDAIQFMRKDAEKAGNLKTTPQMAVTNQGPNVVIQPADPNVVYVPDYDPELVYGYPVALWPGFYPWWGVGGPYLSFGIGYGIGPFFGYGWGWRGWAFDWGHRGLFFGGRPYAFQTHAFYDRNAYFHGNYRGFAPYGRGDRAVRGFTPAERGGAIGARSNEGARGVAPEARGNAPVNRGYAGTKSGAFSGITRGGEARGYFSRGSASMGGGFHGGGARGGGGRR